MIHSHVSSGISSKYPAAATPALLTRMSTPPHSLSNAFEALIKSPGFVTSHWITRGSPPSLFTSLAVSCARCLLISAMAIRQCIFANSIASARPSPLPAPAMMILFLGNRLSRFKIFLLYLLVLLYNLPYIVHLPERRHPEQALDLLGVPHPLFLAVVLHVAVPAQELDAVHCGAAGQFSGMDRRGPGRLVPSGSFRVQLVAPPVQAAPADLNLDGHVCQAHPHLGPVDYPASALEPVFRVLEGLQEGALHDPQGHGCGADGEARLHVIEIFFPFARFPDKGPGRFCKENVDCRARVQSQAEDRLRLFNAVAGSV